jgi:hypothetical protein
MMTYIKGVDEVLSNLNKQINAMQKGSIIGLIYGAVIVRRDMDFTSPTIPVDYGNLRGSWFSTPMYIKGQPAVRVGFTAMYAWYVHEKIGATFQRPGSGPKFLEASLKRNQGKILAEIKKRAKVR